MTANHPRDILDVIAEMKERIRALEGAVSAAPRGPQRIGTQTLASTQPSITLPVPAGWTRLRAYWRARGDSAVVAEPLNLRFNGDTGSHYLWEVNQANNTTLAATTSAGTVGQIQIGTICAASATAAYFASGNFTVDGVSDPANFATAVGSAAAFASPTNMWTGTYSGEWGQPAAVASVTLLPATGNLIAGSSLTLYGL